MKFSAQEEYGLRCLLQIARAGAKSSATIQEISKAEGISAHNAAKLLRILRRGGYVRSSRGQAGGYMLARPPEQILVGEVLAHLGGRLFDESFCDLHAGLNRICTHSVDCSIRSLWNSVQHAVDGVLTNVTLKDLCRSEKQANVRLSRARQPAPIGGL